MDDQQGSIEPLIMRLKAEIKKRQWDAVDDAEAVHALVLEMSSRVGISRAAAAHIAAQFAPFGPMQKFLDDESIEEVWVNGDDRVFISRDGQSELTSEVMTQSELVGIIDRMLRRTHRRLDVQSPFVDVTLPDGSRLHAVVSTITGAAMAVNIRKFPRLPLTLHSLCTRGCMSMNELDFLLSAVRSGASIVVSGSTNSGKTTLVRALLSALPATARIVTCEEVFELAPAALDVVSMQTRPAGIEGSGEITLRKLVVEALRMRPDVLVIGEVRQAEAFDLLIALNSGVQGMCTIHANSAEQALRKLATLPLLAGGNVTSGFVVPTIAESVDLVVHMDRSADGRRRIAEIREVQGIDGVEIKSVPASVTRRAS